MTNSHIYTHEQILELINKRKEVLDEGARTSNREPQVISHPAREQLKNKKIKKVNNISRVVHCEDKSGEGVSDETRQLTLVTDSGYTSPLSFEEKSKAQQEVIVNSPAREQELARTFCGILAQHSKSKTGVKVFLTIQRFNHNPGQVQLITAELKRSDRLREVKPVEGDSEMFIKNLNDIKDQLYEIPKHQRGNMCLGRAHKRGKRDQWISDLFVFGKFNDCGEIEYITVQFKDEEYEIYLTSELSSFQEGKFLTTGRYGEVKTSKVSRSIDDIEVSII